MNLNSENTQNELEIFYFFNNMPIDPKIRKCLKKLDEKQRLLRKNTTQEEEERDNRKKMFVKCTKCKERFHINEMRKVINARNNKFTRYCEKCYSEHTPRWMPSSGSTR